MPAAAPEPQNRKPAAALPRGRLALLAAVAALTVALPLGQVLHAQQDELRRIATRRATLDPLVRAVDVQRGLLAHRDVAARVLRGQDAAEAERRVRQADVDDRLMTLAVALTVGPWDRALQETDQLRDDWHALALRVGARRIAADDSNAGHRLLVEQLLVVVDILDAAQRAGLQDERLAQALSALHTLPRQALLQSQKAAGDWAAPLAAFDQAAQAATRELADARERVEAARLQMLGALGGLLLLGALLAWPWLRRPGLPTPPEPDEGAAAREPDKREVAEGLFERLRGNSPASHDDTPQR